MKNAGGILGALFLGAAVGAVAAVLLAPDKGSETRKKLMDGAMDIAGNLKDKFIKSLEVAEDLYADAHSSETPVATA